MSELSEMSEATRTLFYLPVVDAMQAAEEIGGPHAIQYVCLMNAIIEEAMKRKHVVIERIAKGEIGNHWDL